MVRSKERPYLQSEDLVGVRTFSLNEVPIANHPFITKQKDSKLIERILTQHLYRYLSFTKHLELSSINYVAKMIADGDFPIELPERYISDAYKIYCDEAYHALLSNDLIDQVSVLTGVKPLDFSRPLFLVELEKICNLEEDPVVKDWIKIFFVIVSETLISNSLMKVPEDKAVEKNIRDFLSHHAQDEAWHFIYFSNLLEIVWPKLEEKVQNKVGVLIPKFIRLFFAADKLELIDELVSYKIHMEDAVEVVNDSYTEKSEKLKAKDASKLSIKVFRELGVLENPKYREAFVKEGLID